MGAFLYRYDDVQYEEGPHLLLRQYPVMKTTPKGVWISVYGTWKFVNGTARKRFAYPTKGEALASFQARKQRQIALLSNQLQRAQDARMLAERVDPASPRLEWRWD